MRQYPHHERNDDVTKRTIALGWQLQRLEWLKWCNALEDTTTRTPGSADCVGARQVCAVLVVVIDDDFGPLHHPSPEGNRRTLKLKTDSPPFVNIGGKGCTLQQLRGYG